MIVPDAFCCIAWAFLLLVLPLDWVLSAATAALVHELCHILAVVCLGGKVRRIQIHFTGCQIETDPMGAWRSIVSILAGPAGSVLLLLAARYLPKIAICALFQGVYNLLPVEPLDGGRALRCLLDTCCPGQADGLMRGIRYLLLGAMILAVFYWRGKTVPVICCLAFNLSVLRRKIPCKENRIGLQWY